MAIYKIKLIKEAEKERENSKRKLQVEQKDFLSSYGKMFQQKQALKKVKKPEILGKDEKRIQQSELLKYLERQEISLQSELKLIENGLQELRNLKYSART